jgi:adenylate cyclase
MSGLRELVHRPKPAPVRVPRLLTRILRAGIVTGDPEVARRQIFANICAYVTALNALSHLVIGAAHDFWALMPLHVYNIVIAAVALSLHRLHRYGDNLAAGVLFAMIVAGHSFVVFALGYDSDLQVYFLLVGFLFFLFGVRHWRAWLFFYIAAFVMLIVTVQYGLRDGFLLPHDPAFRDFLRLQALANTMIINGIGIAYAFASLSRAESDLARQVEVSDALVEVLLPRSIATRLKGGAEQVADHVENATVLFADLASFTPAAGAVGPDIVVSYLGGLFSGFDRLCARHGVEKIKTIGDAYMAAAGLSGDPRTGARAIGNLAFDMVAFVEQHGPLGRSGLQLRVGIHSGPLVAGVIGDLRVSYDVWGATVNIAQRLESHGEAGRVQVSSAFRALAGEAFAYERRGVVALKGVPDTETWYLGRPETRDS